MKLPADSDDHMPPDNKPGLTPAEIELVRFWIDRGATETIKASEGIVPDDVSHLLRDRTSGVTTQEPAPTGTPKKPVPDATAKPDSTHTPTPTTPTPTSTGGDRLAFRDDVAPMLQARCGSCHGGGKTKGGLRVDSFEAVSAGGKAHGGAQSLLARVNLPSGDSKHMPPQEETQLNAREQSLLAAWIQHGASDTMKESDLPSNVRGYHPVASKAPTTATTTTTATATTSAPTATTTSTSTSEPAGETVDLWSDVVSGVLTRRCGACHTGAQAEGGLRVADVARMISEKDVVVGKPEESPLFTRMMRPVDDDAHMPPKEKPQPTAEEIEIVKTWIGEGAKANSPFPKSRVPPSLLAAPPATPPTPPASDAHAAEPSSAVAAVKVPPGSAGGCGACAIGARPDSERDWRGAWLFALGLAFVIVRRHGGAASRLRK